MCIECKALAAADWIAGHPVVAAGLAVLAVLLVVVPMVVVR